VKQTRIIILVVLALAGGAVVWWFAIRPVRQRAKARHDVNVLAFVLDKFVQEQGEYPHGDLGTICRLLKGESINGQNPRRLDYVEASAYEQNDKGEFVDPWGTSYRLSFDPVVRVYSCGPNRIDEQGAGDDIASGN
jgi:type II secretory pathway pseudopilin PulG